MTLMAMPMLRPRGGPRYPFAMPAPWSMALCIMAMSTTSWLSVPVVGVADITRSSHQMPALLKHNASAMQVRSMSWMSFVRFLSWMEDDIRELFCIGWYFTPSLQNKRKNIDEIVSDEHHDKGCQAPKRAHVHRLAELWLTGYNSSSRRRDERLVLLLTIGV